MLNQIFIMGRLTRDPELRSTQTGTPVTSFSLAVDRDFKSQYRREGDGFYRRGRLASAPLSLSPATSPRAAWPWWRAACRSATGQDRDGNKRRSAEVVADNVYFGDSKRDGAPAGDYAAGQRRTRQLWRRSAVRRALRRLYRPAWPSPR